MNSAGPSGIFCALLLLAVLCASCGRPAPKPEVKALIRESFDYPAGAQLAKQTGGTGFANEWEVGGFGVSNAADLVIGDGSLTYPGIVSSGNRLVCRTTNQQGVVRDFGPLFKITKGTRYISFLLRPEPPTALIMGPIYYGVVLSFGPDFEVFFGKPGSGLDGQYVLERRGGGFQLSTGVDAKTGETAHLVIKIEFSNNQISALTLYANPGATEPAKGAVIGLHDARIPHFMIYTQGEFSLDEIQVFERYEDIAPQSVEKKSAFIFF